MKIISIDIGISNFAYCIFNKGHIEKWNIINLLPYETCNICNEEAIYKRDKHFFCKKHAKSHINYIVPPKKMLNYNKLNKKELQEFIQTNKIPSDLKIKQKMLDDIKTFYENNNYFEFIQKNKCNNTSLLDIGIKLNNELDKLGKFDIILIEDQLGPNAVRMSCIQYMTSQYYISKNINNIHIISSKHKLEYWTEKSLSYKERKNISIQIANDILLRNKIFENYISFFSKYKKKDDLSDCFLQGVWYLKYNNLMDII